VSDANALIAGAAELADLGGYTSGENTFLTHAAWRVWIQEATEELYQLILAQGGEEMLSITQNFTITTGNSVALTFTETGGGPSNQAFRQLLGVTRDPGTPQRRTVHPFEFAERDSQWMEPRYRLMGHTLFIEPEEQAVGAYQLTYLGGPVNWLTIGDDGDPLSPPILEHYREFIMISAAIKALGKEKSATTDLQARLQEIVEEIETHAGSMDRGEPDKVTDIGDDGSWY
jgi:hypothetical protein